MVEDMGEDRSSSKFKEKAEEEARRICSARSAGSPGGTCWNGEGTVRRKQPWMMGQGSGFDLICFGPDQCTSRGTSPKDKMKAAEQTLRKKIPGKKKPKPRRVQELELYQSIQRRVSEGKVPVGFRVFVIQWPKKKWWERMTNAGGMPDGVDIAHTPFGELLVVPVNEVKPSYQQHVLEGVIDGPDKPFSDRDGRKFWVSEEFKAQISQIFGSVKWQQPLTLAEVEQFGVKLSL